MNDTKIDGKRVYLRSIKKSDAKALSKLANDKSVSRFTHVPYPYNLKIAKTFIEKCSKNQEEMVFAIINKETKEYMGNVSFIRISKKDKRAEIGYWLGKKYRNKGYMTEATRTLIEYGFRKLKLNRIEISCSTKNKASEKVIKDKIKAKFEGILRKRIVLGDKKFHDQEFFSIIKEEYPKIKKQWH
jgi:RimJ/RimL family protein N-acetyltransferase